MLLHHFGRKMDELKGFLGFENCTCYVHLSSMLVSLSSQLWSEGVRISSSPEDVVYDPVPG